MLPILLLALRHGLLWGCLSGLIVGLVQLFFGGYFLNIFQVALDYGLAYAGIGFGGLFSRKFLQDPTAFSASIWITAAGFLGGSMRLLGSFLSGMIFYADYAPAGTPVWIYSFSYNFTYVLPSTILTIIALRLLYQARPQFFRR
ncbi:Substrate-specific component ThiT of thiamin ECF transporter [Streptococcus sp. DD13]|nr:Substrate-specific component ThiT of thiamin ECF transporter [Streptococcus sp. DD13]